MDSLKKIFLQSPGHYAAALIVAVLAGVFRYATLPEGVGVRYALYEIFSVSGYVTFLIGGLVTVAYFGAFDLFGYVFSPGRRKYRNYAQYSEVKTQERGRDGYYFVPYFVVGILVVLISLFFG